MKTNEQDLAALSALMDDEAQELELRRLLASVAEDPVLRARWRRQQLVRDLIQGRQVNRSELDVTAGVREAIGRQPGVARNPLWSMAVAASVTIAVVLAGQTLMPVDQVVPRTLVSELGGNVVPVSGAQPVRASLEAGAIPLAGAAGGPEEAQGTGVSARYERLARERYQRLNVHHAAVASQNHPAPYIARVRSEDAVDRPQTTE